MSKASLKRWVFNLFLKSTMSETVRKSAGRELHAAGPEKYLFHLWWVTIIFLQHFDAVCHRVTGMTLQKSEPLFSQFPWKKRKETKR